MNTLHLLNKAPEHHRSEDCLEALEPGDGLLLYQDAVLLMAVARERLPEDVSLHVLRPDAEARAIRPELADSASYEDFVTLTLNASQVVCW